MTGGGVDRPRRVVIVGAGMAGARLAEDLRRGEPDPARLSVTVLGAEAEDPYNRIMLSHEVAGIPGAAARLKPEGWWARRGIDLRVATPVEEIDRTAREVVLGGACTGERVPYDELVLATGAAAAIPPIEGIRGADGGLAPGAFTLRDAVDGRALTAHLAATPGPVALVGGGFIGLEVACALARAGREVVVVHSRAWPMHSHLDHDAGRVLLHALAGLGIRVVTGARAVSWGGAAWEGAAWEGSGLRLDDGEVIRCGTVVLSAGTRPRTALAEAAGLEVRTGIVVDDALRTSDPAISALGDCAEHRGCVSGLVSPAWDQAAVLEARIGGADPDARYTGGTEITRLKAFGVDVVSLGSLAGDVHDPAVEVTVISEPARGRYARVDVRRDGCGGCCGDGREEAVVEGCGGVGRVVGAVLVGHPEPVGTLTQLYEHGLPVPDDVVSVLLGRATAAAAETPATMPAAAVVCRCNGVSKGDLVTAWGDGARDAADLAERTRAGTGCGGCAAAVDGICGWLREAA